MDGPDNIITARRFGIHSYPSLYLMRDGRTYEYNIQRDGLSLKQVRAHCTIDFWKALNCSLPMMNDCQHALGEGLERVRALEKGF